MLICRNVCSGFFKAWHGFFGAMPVCLLFVAPLFFLSHGTAFPQTHQMAFPAGDGIVICGVDPHTVILEDGRISVREGQSVSLLPGTRIGRGDVYGISIVRREHYEELAKEAENDRRKEAFKSIISHCNQSGMESEGFHSNALLSPSLPSSPKSRLTTQSCLLHAFPSRTISTIKLASCLLHKHQDKQDMQHLHEAWISHHVYEPDNSWGERAETIKVMRS